MGRPELPDGRAVAALGARPEPRRRGAPAPISFRGRRGGRGPQPGCGRSARPRRPRRGKMAAAAQALSGAGLLLAAAALALLAVAIGTDSWYETDARRHRERCRGFGHKRSDPPGSMSAPSSHLPLRARPPRALLPGRPPAPAPAAAAAALDSHCGRRFNSTVSGLWRRCHRAGYEPDSEELIRKGAGRRRGGQGGGGEGEVAPLALLSVVLSAADGGARCGCGSGRPWLGLPRCHGPLGASPSSLNAAVPAGTAASGAPFVGRCWAWCSAWGALPTLTSCRSVQRDVWSCL